jgi:hypothetical protein
MLRALIRTLHQGGAMAAQTVTISGAVCCTVAMLRTIFGCAAVAFGRSLQRIGAKPS